MEGIISYEERVPENHKGKEKKPEKFILFSGRTFANIGSAFGFIVILNSYPIFWVFHVFSHFQF